MCQSFGGGGKVFVYFSPKGQGFSPKGQGSSVMIAGTEWALNFLNGFKFHFSPESESDDSESIQAISLTSKTNNGKKIGGRTNGNGLVSIFGDRGVKFDVNIVFFQSEPFDR